MQTIMILISSSLLYLKSVNNQDIFELIKSKITNYIKINEYHNNY